MIKPGIYRHYKGQYYRVFEVAKHSETESLFVIYRPLYGEGNLWARPFDNFCDTVSVSGTTQPRFALVENYNE